MPEQHCLLLKQDSYCQTDSTKPKSHNHHMLYRKTACNMTENQIPLKAIASVEAYIQEINKFSTSKEQ